MSDHVLSTSSIQREFFAVYQLLHPRGGEMQELLDANVRARSVLNLYPLEVEHITSWLRALMKDDRKKILAFSKQIYSTTQSLSLLFFANNSDRNKVRFRLEGYDDLITSPDGQWWTGNWANEKDAKYASWAQRSVAEMLWSVAHWNELHELWGTQNQCADAMRALHSALIEHRKG